ncbi:AmmeMemoRadiSam system protein B [Shewanella nanhaiensis]|uniref:MEMO1 family protein K0625_07195 n=1 Tax=Shewanella nanhaiensis TaxID=2864872 RepID=A0ABS7E1C5_9GAMM|nr:AmmeMemoRadiSam system protein B [Shewanella nanhaiensis]MBW8183449.1 AmmeMemoRadiSam system protein B [Shewanella nanhaiensis]
MTSLTRQAAVAGRFYPAEATPLKQMINTFLGRCASQMDDPKLKSSPTKVIIVPHAGYIYSGQVAASAFALLAPRREQIKRVVLLGPAHRVHLKGCALPSSESFETPLGQQLIDKDALRQLSEHSKVLISDLPHNEEHCLEVELPFLQLCLDKFELIPLLVGDISPHAMASILEQVWGGDETLIVVSSDLSHYHSYQEAAELDRETCKQIINHNSALTPEQACGSRALNAIAIQAEYHKLQTHQLSYQNSGDTSGNRGRVVGYASFALY